MCQHPPRSRRAFAVHTLAVVLVLVLLVLCAYIVYFRLTAIPPGSGITNKLSTSQTITTYSVIALFIIAVAGGIGSLTYLLSGKRQGPANAAICVVLSLGIAVLGYSLARNRAALSSALQRVAGAQPAPATNPPAPAPRLPATQTRPTPPAPAAPAPSPAPTANPAPTPAPAVPAPAEVPSADTDALTKFLDAFDADITAYRTTLASTIPLVRATPPRSRTQLTDRLKAARTLATESTALRDRAMNIQTTAREHLSTLGVSDPDATRVIMNQHNRFFAISGAIHEFMRASMAAEIAASEAQLLLDNYNSWSLAAGKITSRDNVLLARINAARASTLSATESLDTPPAAPAPR